MLFERFLGQAVLWSLLCFSSENTVEWWHWKTIFHAQLLSQYCGKATLRLSNEEQELPFINKCEETDLEETTQEKLLKPAALKPSQFRLEHCCTLDFVILTSCSYQTAATNPTLFPPGFLFTLQPSPALKGQFTVPAPESFSSVPHPEMQSPAGAPALGRVEGAQKLIPTGNSSQLEASNSSLLSCPWCLRPGSHLQAQQRNSPPIIPIYFRVKCSMESGIIKPALIWRKQRLWQKTGIGQLCTAHLLLIMDNLAVCF